MVELYTVQSCSVLIANMGPNNRHIYFLMAILVLISFVFKTSLCRLPLLESCPNLCSCEDLTLTVNCSNLGLDVVPSARNNTRVFNFDSNRLRYIGKKVFSQLNNLRMLSAANNVIDEIQEDSFKNQAKLVKLDLHGNNFGEVPLAISDLRILKELDLRNNQIRTLSKETWSNVIRLSVLLLDNNNASNLPMALTSRLKRLTHLSFSRNDISSILPGQFLNNTNLLYLDLSYNRITTRPDLNNGYFDYSNNQTSILPTVPDDPDDTLANGLSEESLKGLVNLKELNLAGNLIHRLDNGVFDDLRSLQELILDNNGLEFIQETVFQEQYDLRILRMSYNALTEIPQRVFEDLRLLKVLYLDNNHIVAINSLTDVHMFHLNSLYLNNNRIKSIDSPGFESFRDLEEIHLQRNELRYVPEVRNLSRLHYLNLARNRIKVILPERAFEGTKLTEIYLQHNRLQKLSFDSFRYLDHLEILRVDSDTYECDCTMKWINDPMNFNNYNWMQGIPEISSPLDYQILCESPRLLNGNNLYDALQKNLRLLCTDYVNPHRVMILVSTWGGFVVFALVAFWLYTYYDFKRRFYVRKPRKRYLLLNTSDLKDAMFLSGNHSKVRFRSFDAENEIYIYDEETTV